jgi:hypothetical protein
MKASVNYVGKVLWLLAFSVSRKYSNRNNQTLQLLVFYNGCQGREAKVRLFRINFINMKMCAVFQLYQTNFLEKKENIHEEI